MLNLSLIITTSYNYYCKSYVKNDLPSVVDHVSGQPTHQRSSRAIGHRLSALLLLTLVLAGCGSSSGGGGSAHRDSSGSGGERAPRNRTALVAWQEWNKFGHSTVVYGSRANGHSNRTGVTERSEPLRSRVGDYWGSCGHPEWNGRTAGKPWSAAFVSWVMGHSGASAFPAAGRHGQYLAALYDRQSRGRSAFTLHSPGEYAPRPGDLVCVGTTGPTWRHADQRTARRRLDAAAKHCDVVTDVRGGYVHAVGGNVKNSVTMSLYPVDGRGRLLDSAGKRWLVVVENRS